jgi:iron complex outermembrane receptor protein
MASDRSVSRAQSSDPFRSSLLAAAVLLAPAAAQAQAGQAQAGQPVPDNAAPPTLGEVLVTARKTQERLQDVPIAISVVGGGDFRDADHVRIEDLNLFTPNTNIDIVNGHQASFAIRGLGNNPANDGLEGSTGVFLDGVYLGRPGEAAQDLIDVSQIEVLRGPQGTLFGKNTTAGAVNITTDAPSFRFGGQGQISYGNYNYQQYQGAVTGPLVGDVLAGRLTAYKTSRDGTVYDVTTHDHVNDLDRQGVRGQLLYRPNDNLSVRVIADYAREAQSTGAVLTFSNLGITPSSITAKLAASGGTIAVDPDGLRTAVDGPIATGTEQWGFSGQADWKVGGFTVTSITAYRHWIYNSLSDSDGSSAPVINAGYNEKDAQWSQELRVAFPKMGPVDAVAGAYYFNQSVQSDQITEYGQEAGAFLTGVPDALLPIYARLSTALAAVVAYDNSRWDVISTPGTQSYAAFGQGVWHVTPSWNLTLGFRETYETKQETVSRAAPISTLTEATSPALAYNAVAPVSVGINNASPSFLISTDYHLATGLMGYAFVSHGEKAGGVNAALPAAGEGPNSLKVKPEVATDYELGLKSELFDRRLTFNAGLFYTDVRDYQATYFASVNNTTVQILSNVGEVVSQGAEAEAMARPISGLTLHGSLGYDDAHYASYTNAPCPVEITGRTICSLSGRPVVGAPRWTANAYSLYEHPLGPVTGYGRAEVSWRSQFYGYQDDSASTVVPAYALVNLYLGVKSPSGHWDLMLWGKNISNVHAPYSYLSYGSLLPGAYVPFFSDPATYGVTLRASF